jgi:hypothetical protein
MNTPTYRQHLVTVRGDDGTASNYALFCTCGWGLLLASLSDVHAAEAALEHVKGSQPPADPFQGL